ncbi:MAG: DUF2125 domain-containing protein [Hyphomicrobiales bacterium]
MTASQRPQRSSALRYAALAGALILVGLGWTVAWNVLADRADTELGRHLDRAAERGSRLVCGDRTISGYPFRFEVECTRPQLVLARAGNLEVAATRLRLAGMIWQPLRLVGFLDGPAEIYDPRSGRRYKASWTGAEGSVGFATLHIDRISAVFSSLEVIEADISDRAARLAAAGLEIHGRPSAGPDAGPGDVDIAVSADRLVLSDGTRTTPEIALAADTTARNALDSLLGARNLPDFLRQWQAADGALEIAAARLAVGADVLASGSGRLRLDDGGRLTGNLDASVAGLEKLLGPKNGLVAVLGAAVLGPETELEGRKARTARLRLDAGKVSLGPLAIAELAPLY